MLGSDRRSPGTKEPGATVSGPSRSDSIMLLRFGGGHSAKLSIPRDTVVDIPGHGRDKINAAYAIGGPALTIQTVEQYLGIDIDHVFLVNFANFPSLIDAMGGIDYTGGCVVSRINGGFKNGGYTLRLKRGTTHIDGQQALALARTRKNLCNPREDDRTRARRQQKILSAMKGRVFSLGGFLRLPLISWNVPKSVQSDMGGPRLLAYALGLAFNGNAPTRVLQAERARDPAERRGGPGRLATPRSRPRSSGSCGDAGAPASPSSWRTSTRSPRPSSSPDSLLELRPPSSRTRTTSRATRRTTTTPASRRRRRRPSARARGCGASCRSRCCRSPCP